LEEIFELYILAGAFAMAQSGAATGRGDGPDAYEKVTGRRKIGFGSVRRSQDEQDEQVIWGCTKKS